MEVSFFKGPNISESRCRLSYKHNAVKLVDVTLTLCSVFVSIPFILVRRLCTYKDKYET